jgi:hypothetical protein
VNDVVVDENVPVEVRDGAILRADVYRRSGKGSAAAARVSHAVRKAGEAFGADAQERCRTEMPALEQVTPGHVAACHYWREIEAQPAETAGSEALATEG